jgi:hypothetical protein
MFDLLITSFQFCISVSTEVMRSGWLAEKPLA